MRLRDRAALGLLIVLACFVSFLAHSEEIRGHVVRVVSASSSPISIFENIGVLDVDVDKNADRALPISSKALRFHDRIDRLSTGYTSRLIRVNNPYSRRLLAFKGGDRWFRIEWTRGGFVNEGSIQSRSFSAVCEEVENVGHVLACLRLILQSERGYVYPWSLIYYKGCSSGISSTLSSTRGFDCGTRLLVGVMGVESSDNYEEYRTSGLMITRPVRWFLCVIFLFASIASTIAAFAVFVSFDRWRRGWRWGLARCAAISALIWLAFHGVLLGVSIIGA